MGEGWTGGASDIVKAKSSGEDPRATGGLVSIFPHPRVNKTKQHTLQNNIHVSKVHCGSAVRFGRESVDHLIIAHHLGHAVSRLAPQPLRATRSQPESIRIFVFLGFLGFFWIFFHSDPDLRCPVFDFKKSHVFIQQTKTQTKSHIVFALICCDEMFCWWQSPLHILI